MKRIDVTDEWLYQHMPIVDEAMIKELEKEVDDTYQFSDKFEKKMKKTIQMEKRNSFINILHLKRKWVAVFVACIIGFSLSQVESVQAYGIRLFEVIKTFFVDEGAVMYQYFTDSEDESLLKVQPAYMTEGYEIIHHVDSDLAVYFVWMNTEGDQVVWIQDKVTDEMQIVFDTEYDAEEELILKDGSKVTLSLYGDGYIRAYYEYGKTIITLSSETLAKEEIQKIFDSIEPFIVTSEDNTES